MINLSFLLPIAKTVYEVAKPGLNIAKDVAVAGVAFGAVVKGTQLIGKGLDGIRHMVGYEDNIFQEDQPTPQTVEQKAKRKAKPKVVKKGNVAKASGNRSAKQLAGDKKRKATAKKKQAAIKSGNIGERSETLKK